MTRDDIQATVDRMYEASSVGDWDTIATLITDDFEAVEADHLPMAGTFAGLEGYQRLFTTVFGLVDVARLERIQDCIGGDLCVTVLRLHFADAALEPVEIAEMFRLRGGKVCAIKPYYYNPAAFDAAVAAKRALAGAHA